MNPKIDNFYMPPEWHEHKCCWMAWPRHQETWSGIGMQQAREAYTRIAKAINKFEPVKMLVHPEDLVSAKNLLGDEIELFIQEIDDSWTRDTGPTFLLNQAGELAGVDWIHNAWGGNYQEYSLDSKIAKSIIEEARAKYYHAPLVMEGGSFHVDGEGTLLTTEECLLNKNRNPKLSRQKIENYLCNYLNIEKIIWLNKGLIGDETDGHVDEISCFIRPGVVLTLITDDKNDENYHNLQENLEILKTTKDARGRNLEVHTVSQPPAQYLNGERLTISYINFYLANNGIVMPAFGAEQYDREAFLLFRKIFKDLEITQVPALDLFSGGGGIHCITQQEPKSNSF
ncbi:MAG: agmatine deiminase [Legionellales bacterium RIFCSPHIGHO2_12_FULL_35_11]|nr:MAG: agmatine deiminase [Legionellales bacterium RIFCSPHIGHO2_12_FULL_35_11]